jgi:hypothetical protein
VTAKPLKFDLDDRTGEVVVTTKRGTIAISGTEEGICVMGTHAKDARQHMTALDVRPGSSNVIYVRLARRDECK